MSFGWTLVLISATLVVLLIVVVSGALWSIGRMLGIDIYTSHTSRKQKQKHG